MYDLGKRIEVHFSTVGALIEQFQKLNKDANVFCCGDYQLFIHVSKDGKRVCIDNDPLDDEYDEECDGRG